MIFSWKNQPKPMICLAPMANITTMPFRSICREFGADIVFTPMLSSNAMIHNPEKTLKIAEFLPQEQPVIVQIFGYDGELIAKAAKTAYKGLRCVGIDINMGCPAPKITGNECGSALLKDLEKARRIVGVVRDKFDGQLSVKLRLGWDSFDISEFVKELENLGIDAISVHGRTAKQGYSGKADWETIYSLADSVSIPVIGNGDVDSLTAARLRTKNGKLAGIMIGRAALGNPWIFKSIKENRETVPTKEELVETIKTQTERSIEYIGEQGIKEMRKHLCWYLKDFDGAKDLRKQSVMVESKQDVEDLLENLRLTISDGQPARTS
jgi:tRNA-dihydrouridine synthase B